GPPFYRTRLSNPGIVHQVPIVGGARRTLAPLPPPAHPERCIVPGAPAIPSGTFLQPTQGPPAVRDGR
ncbi:MAG: hypothetical protein NTW51_12370, partial [Cyanobacteria bacterium]|nr:hypothetical protein [Cyanobacteriota bacterium]